MTGRFKFAIIPKRAAEDEVEKMKLTGA